MGGSERRARVVGLATGAWFAGAIAVSIAAGVPDRLPAVALGSGLLLVGERVAALMIVFVVVAVILDRGSRGELPIEFRGVKYADRDATELLAKNTQRAIVALADAVDAVEARVDAIDGGG